MYFIIGGCTFVPVIIMVTIFVFCWIRYKNKKQEKQLTPTIASTMPVIGKESPISSSVTDGVDGPKIELGARCSLGSSSSLYEDVRSRYGEASTVTTTNGETQTNGEE